MTEQGTLHPPVDIVVFGGTGDLARRKLLPALFLIQQAGYLGKDGRIIAIARTAMDIDHFRQTIALPSLHEYVDKDKLHQKSIEQFLNSLSYFSVDAETGGEAWQPIANTLDQHRQRVRAFYLAVGSDFFTPLCQRLQENKLITAQSRLVVEKPIGKDLASSQALNDAIGNFFSESQIFRIDHYLGKETVQNLMALRFANALFEPIWDSRYIDHVQITVAESIGVKGRSGYYDQFGAMRDMVQNHMLQLLCLVAMEPPSHFSADAVRDEKLKVLHALKAIDVSNIDDLTVRGQYTSSDDYSSYAEDINDDESIRESFVALKTEVSNWRWSGTPFYMRTGKRLSNRLSEITIHFRNIPHSIFATKAGHILNNVLTIRLQPDEGINLYIMIKDPSSKNIRFRQVPLDMTFAETLDASGSRLPDAYERLLMDVIRGDQTLFMRRDEVEASWSWVDPIINAWHKVGSPPYPYKSGSDGPFESVRVIQDDNRKWRDLK